MDPYKVLQVDPEAEDEVIQAAYRRLAQKYHPDVAGPEGVARMTAINVAWELLRDPARRAAHDRTRRGPGASEPAGGPGDSAGPAGWSSGARPDTPTPGRGSAARPADSVSSDWT